MSDGAVSDANPATAGIGDGLWNLPIAMFAVANRAGYFTAVNPSWEPILGHTPAELTSRPYLDFVHPDDLARTIAEAAALLDGEHTTINFENRYRRKDGTYCWLSWIAQPTQDGKNLYCIATDITKQMQARQALAASEQRYRLLAENSTEIVMQTDTNGVMLWISPSLESILGWQPSQLIGANTHEFVHPADTEVMALWKAELFAGRKVPVFELRMQTAAGRHLWMSIQSRPTINPNGSVSGVIIWLRDVNRAVLAREEVARQQVQARDQTARSDRLLRLSMDSATAGMAVIGLDLRFEQVNPALCAMLDRDEQWLLAHTVQDVTHPDDLEEDLAGRGELLTGTFEANVRELRWVRADDSELWVVHSSRLLRDEDRRPLSYLSNIQDNSRTHRRQGEVSHLPARDAITGLINREQLHEHVSDVLKLDPQFGGVPGVLSCDLDDFGRVNENYGPQIAEKVLRLALGRVTSVLRDADLVARLSTDEFVVVLNEVRNLAAALIVAEKISQAISEPLPIGNEIINMTVSIGIALADPGIDADRLLQDSASARSEASEFGPACIVTFNND